MSNDCALSLSYVLLRLAVLFYLYTLTFVMLNCLIVLSL